MCVFCNVWDSFVAKADGMLGSILGGIHAYKLLDVVLLQQRWKDAQEMKRVWKWRENKWQKVEVGRSEKKQCLLCCHLPPLSFLLTDYGCHCFQFCSKAFFFLFLSHSFSECFLTLTDQSGDKLSFFVTQVGEQWNYSFFSLYLTFTLVKIYC